MLVVVELVSELSIVQRGNFGEERYERIDFQKKVREQFMLLKGEDEAAGALDWHVIDARQSIEDIHAQIVAIVDKVMASTAGKPIARLWQK
jgi:dTMP kinase